MSPLLKTPVKDKVIHVVYAARANDGSLELVAISWAFCCAQSEGLKGWSSERGNRPTRGKTFRSLAGRGSRALAVE
eukprot:9407388-Pyramimonas_sp.AAC.1